MYICENVKYMPLFTCARDTQKTQLIKIKDIPFYGHFKFIKAQFKRMYIMYNVYLRNIQPCLLV